MLAVTITDRLHDPSSDLPRPPPDEPPDPDEVLMAAMGPWRIPGAVVKSAADWLVVTASEAIVGVYRITGVSRYKEDPRLAIFDLGPAPTWQWAIGRTNPFLF